MIKAVFPLWWSAHTRAALAPEATGRRSEYGGDSMLFPAPVGQKLLVEVTYTHALWGEAHVSLPQGMLSV